MAQSGIRIRHWIRTHRHWLIMAALLLVALMIAIPFLPLKAWAQWLMDHVEAAGVWGMVFFMVANAVSAVLLIPGWIFTAAAGLLYGAGLGTVIAHTGSMTGAALAFLCGRHLFRKRLRRYFEHNKKFQMIDEAIGRQGWKIVCLVRLSPVVPFFLQNYLYSVTSIRFWHYVICSVICCLPGTVLHVCMGVAGRYGVLGEKTAVSPWQWMLLGVGALSTVAASLYVRRIAKRAVGEAAVVIED